MNTSLLIMSLFIATVIVISMKIMSIHIITKIDEIFDNRDRSLFRESASNSEEDEK